MYDRYTFRGKRIDNGEWVYGYYSYIPKSIFCAHDRHFISRVLSDDPDDFDIAIIDPATVGQCTGLRDRKGKAIFEGDIVQGLDRVCYVTWHERCAQWDCDFVRYTTRDLLTNGLAAVELPRQAVVIGNIHDNSDLLEVKSYA